MPAPRRRLATRLCSLDRGPRRAGQPGRVRRRLTRRWARPTLWRLDRRGRDEAFAPGARPVCDRSSHIIRRTDGAWSRNRRASSRAAADLAGGRRHPGALPGTRPGWARRPPPRRDSPLATCTSAASAAIAHHVFNLVRRRLVAGGASSATGAAASCRSRVERPSTAAGPREGCQAAGRQETGDRPRVDHLRVTRSTPDAPQNPVLAPAGPADGAGSWRGRWQGRGLHPARIVAGLAAPPFPPTARCPRRGVLRISRDRRGARAPRPGRWPRRGPSRRPRWRCGRG